MRQLVRSTAVAAVTLAGLVAVALPAHAETPLPNPLSGQPLVSVSDSNGQVCVGFSYEVPFCVPLSIGS